MIEKLRSAFLTIFAAAALTAAVVFAAANPVTMQGPPTPPKAFGAPTSLGSTGAGGACGGGGGTICTFTTSAAIPYCNYILVAATQSGNAAASASATGVTVGTNTLSVIGTVANNPTNGNGVAEIWGKACADATASGSTVTVTYAASTSIYTIMAVQLQGAASASATDVVPAGVNGQSVAPTITSASIAQTPEIVFGVLWWNAALGHFTEAAGYTNIVQNAASGDAYSISYKQVSAIGTQTYNPALSSGTDRWSVQLVSIK